MRPERNNSQQMAGHRLTMPAHTILYGYAVEGDWSSGALGPPWRRTIGNKRNNKTGSPTSSTRPGFPLSFDCWPNLVFQLPINWAGPPGGSSLEKPDCWTAEERIFLLCWDDGRARPGQAIHLKKKEMDGWMEGKTRREMEREIDGYFAHPTRQRMANGVKVNRVLYSTESAH